MFEKSAKSYGGVVPRKKMQKVKKVVGMLRYQVSGNIEIQRKLKGRHLGKILPQPPTLVGYLK